MLNRTLGEVLDESGGSLKTGPFGTKLKASEYTTNGAPVISVGEVGYGHLRVSEKSKRVPDSITERMPEFLLKPGDIVFGRKGAVDRSAWVRRHEAGYFLGSDGIRVRFGRGVDSRFMAYQLQSQRVREWLLQHAVGTTLASLNEPTLRSVPVLAPSLNEQRAIAATLGALDDKIESNRRASELSQDLLRARFRAWFNDYLPWGGQRPTEWRDGKLRDVVDLVRSPTKPGSQPELPYVPIDTIPIKSLGLTHSRDNSDAQSSLFTFEANDILLGAMRVYFHRVALAPYAGITRNTTFVLRPKSPSHLAFALLTLDDDATIAYAGATSKGSTMPYAVWDGALAEMPLFIPPEETIERFGDECAPLIKMVRDQMFQSTKLQALRDALLPNLLTGRIKVRAEGVEA